MSKPSFRFLSLLGILLLIVLPGLATAQSVSSLVLEPPSVPGGYSSRGVVTLTSAATGNGRLVSVSSDKAFVQVPSLVRVVAGQTSAKFTVKTSPLSSTDTATLTATASGTATAVMTVLSASIRNVELTPNPAIGGAAVQGKVNLAGTAPAGGLTVALTSSGAFAHVPANVMVAAGNGSATFSIPTDSVATSKFAIVTATLGASSASRPLFVNPAAVTALSFSPGVVVGGAGTVGTVTIDAPAGAPGVDVRVWSENSAVKAPLTVTIPSGSTQATFNATTIALASQQLARVTAKTSGSPVAATVIVNPPTPASLTLAPTSVTGGTSSKATVTLTGAAPAGGIDIALSCDKSYAQTPASIHLTTGATSGIFTVTSSAVDADGKAAITTAVGGGTKSANLTVLSPPVASVAVDPAIVTGGTSATGKVFLVNPAPAGGVVVTLQSDRSFATPPVSVRVPVGSVSTTFTVSTAGVVSTQNATLTATAGGIRVTATLTVASPQDTIVSIIAPGRTLLFAAAQDGNQVWRTIPVTGDHAVAIVTDPSGRYGLTVVYAEPNGKIVTSIHQATLSEIKAIVIPADNPTYDTGEVSGSLSNLPTGSSVSLMGFGRGFSSLTKNGAFSASLPKKAPWDLVSALYGPRNTFQGLEIRRNLSSTPISGINLDASQFLMPTEEFSLLGSGDSIGFALSYAASSYLQTVNGTLSSVIDTQRDAHYSFYGLPASFQDAGDRYYATLTDYSENFNGDFGGWSVSSTGVAVGAPHDIELNLDFPSDPLAFSSIGAAGHEVGQVTWNELSPNLKALENTFIGTGVSHACFASVGWLGKNLSNYTYTSPDFAGLPGWNISWNLGKFTSSEAKIIVNNGAFADLYDSTRPISDGYISTTYFIRYVAN
ncbi:hypothetical protein [Fimbriimonas ginsengisoli]|nr:hypothetical protein [Fimbriimonas ginsengisoli]